SHFACSSRYASAASRVQTSCSGAIWARRSSSAALSRADVLWISCRTVYSISSKLYERTGAMISASDRGADGADLMRVTLGRLAQGALVDPHGFGDALQRDVQLCRLGVPAVHDISEPCRRDASPHRRRNADHLPDE